jgi:hypothetical protein
MQIRRRYAKTIMASSRRDHLAHNVGFLRYTAFKTRQQYGRRPCIYRWHFKRVALTEEGLTKALVNIVNGYNMVEWRI